MLFCTKGFVKSTTLSRIDVTINGPATSTSYARNTSIILGRWTQVCWNASNQQASKV